MSDLAKFVAAALKERVAVDLEEENEKLDKKVETLETERAKSLEYASRNGKIEITGKGGSPVYARGEMVRAEFFDMTPIREHKLTLICDDPTLCPIKSVMEAEIRLNGMLITPLSEGIPFDATSRVGDEHFKSCFMVDVDKHGVGGLWKESGLFLSVTFGPVPDPSQEYVFNMFGDISAYDNTDMRNNEFDEVRFTDFSVSSWYDPAISMPHGEN